MSVFKNLLPPKPAAPAFGEPTPLVLASDPYSRALAQVGKTPGFQKSVDRLAQFNLAQGYGAPGPFGGMDAMGVDLPDPGMELGAAVGHGKFAPANQPYGTDWANEDETQFNLFGRVVDRKDILGTEGGSTLLKIASANRQGRRGFWGALSGGPATDFVPFLGQFAALGVSFRNMKKVRDTFKKIDEEGIEALSLDELVLAKTYEAQSERQANQTWGGLVASIIRQAPAFAVEFALTGGATRAAGAAIRATAGATAKSTAAKAGARAATAYVGTGIRTLKANNALTAEAVKALVADSATQAGRRAAQLHSATRGFKKLSETAASQSLKVVEQTARKAAMEAGTAAATVMQTPGALRATGRFFKDYVSRGAIGMFGDVVEVMPTTNMAALRHALGILAVEAPVRGMIIGATTSGLVRPAIEALTGAEFVSHDEIMFSRSQNPRVRANAKALAIGSYVAEMASESSGEAYTALGGILKRFASPATRALRRGASAVVDPHLTPRALGTKVEKFILDVGARNAIQEGMTEIEQEAFVAGLRRAIHQSAGEVTDEAMKRARAEVLALRGKTAVGYWWARQVTKLGLTPAEATKKLEALGYHGWLEEFMEERYGDFLRGLFGMTDDPSDKFGERVMESFKDAFLIDENGKFDWHQASAEIVAFALPSLFTQATSRAVRGYAHTTFNHAAALNDLGVTILSNANNRVILSEGRSNRGVVQELARRKAHNLQEIERTQQTIAEIDAGSTEVQLPEGVTSMEAYRATLEDLLLSQEEERTKRASPEHVDQDLLDEWKTSYIEPSNVTLSETEKKLRADRHSTMDAAADIDAFVNHLVQLTHGADKIHEQEGSRSRRVARTLVGLVNTVATGNPMMVFNNPVQAMFQHNLGNTGRQLLFQAQMHREYLYKKEAHRRNMALQDAVAEGKLVRVNREADHQSILEAIDAPFRESVRDLAARFFETHGAPIIDDAFRQRYVRAALKDETKFARRNGKIAIEEANQTRLLTEKEFIAEYNQTIDAVIRNQVQFANVGGRTQIILQQDPAANPMKAFVEASLERGFQVQSTIDSSDPSFDFSEPAPHRYESLPMAQYELELALGGSAVVSTRAQEIVREATENGATITQENARRQAELESDAALLRLAYEANLVNRVSPQAFAQGLESAREVARMILFAADNFMTRTYEVDGGVVTLTRVVDRVHSPGSTDPGATSFRQLFQIYDARKKRGTREDGRPAPVTTQLVVDTWADAEAELMERFQGAKPRGTGEVKFVPAYNMWVPVAAALPHIPGVANEYLWRSMEDNVAANPFSNVDEADPASFQAAMKLALGTLEKARVWERMSEAEKKKAGVDGTHRAERQAYMEALYDGADHNTPKGWEYAAKEAAEAANFRTTLRPGSTSEFGYILSPGVYNHGGNLYITYAHLTNTAAIVEDAFHTRQRMVDLVALQAASRYQAGALSEADASANRAGVFVQWNGATKTLGYTPAVKNFIGQVQRVLIGAHDHGFADLSESSRVAAQKRARWMAENWFNPEAYSHEGLGHVFSAVVSMQVGDVQGGAYADVYAVLNAVAGSIRGEDAATGDADAIERRQAYVGFLYTVARMFTGGARAHDLQAVLRHLNTNFVPNRHKDNAFRVNSDTIPPLQERSEVAPPRSRQDTPVVLPVTLIPNADGAGRINETNPNQIADYVPPSLLASFTRVEDRNAWLVELRDEWNAHVSATKVELQKLAAVEGGGNVRLAAAFMPLTRIEGFAEFAREFAKAPTESIVEAAQREEATPLEGDPEATPSWSLVDNLIQAPDLFASFASNYATYALPGYGAPPPNTAPFEERAEYAANFWRYINPDWSETTIQRVKDSMIETWEARKRAAEGVAAKRGESDTPSETAIQMTQQFDARFGVQQDLLKNVEVAEYDDPEALNSAAIGEAEAGNRYEDDAGTGASARMAALFSGLFTRFFPGSMGNPVKFFHGLRMNALRDGHTGPGSIHHLLDLTPARNEADLHPMYRGEEAATKWVNESLEKAKNDPNSPEAQRERVFLYSLFRTLGHAGSMRFLAMLRGSTPIAGVTLRVSGEIKSPRVDSRRQNSSNPDFISGAATTALEGFTRNREQVLKTWESTLERVRKATDMSKDGPLNLTGRLDALKETWAQYSENEKIAAVGEIVRGATNFLAGIYGDVFQDHTNVVSDAFRSPHVIDKMVRSITEDLMAGTHFQNSFFRLLSATSWGKRVNMPFGVLGLESSTLPSLISWGRGYAPSADTRTAAYKRLLGIFSALHWDGQTQISTDGKGDAGRRSGLSNMLGYYAESTPATQARVHGETTVRLVAPGFSPALMNLLTHDSFRKLFGVDGLNPATGAEWIDPRSSATWADGTPVLVRFASYTDAKGKETSKPTAQALTAAGHRILQDEKGGEFIPVLIPSTEQIRPLAIMMPRRVFQTHKGADGEPMSLRTSDGAVKSYDVVYNRILQIMNMVNERGKPEFQMSTKRLKTLLGSLAPVAEVGTMASVTYVGGRASAGTGFYVDQHNTVRHSFGAQDAQAMLKVHLVDTKGETFYKGLFRDAGYQRDFARAEDLNDMVKLAQDNLRKPLKGADGEDLGVPAQSVVIDLEVMKEDSSKAAIVEYLEGRTDVVPDGMEAFEYTPASGEPTRALRGMRELLPLRAATVFDSARMKPRKTSLPHSRITNALAASSHDWALLAYSSMAEALEARFPFEFKMEDIARTEGVASMIERNIIPALSHQVTRLHEADLVKRLGKKVDPQAPGFGLHAAAVTSRVGESHGATPVIVEGYRDSEGVKRHALLPADIQIGGHERPALLINTKHKDLQGRTLAEQKATIQAAIEAIRYGDRGSRARENRVWEMLTDLNGNAYNLEGPGRKPSFGDLITADGTFDPAAWNDKVSISGVAHTALGGTLLVVTRVPGVNQERTTLYARWAGPMTLKDKATPWRASDEAIIASPTGFLLLSGHDNDGDTLEVAAYRPERSGNILRDMPSRLEMSAFINEINDAEMTRPQAQKLWSLMETRIANAILDLRRVALDSVLDVPDTNPNVVSEEYKQQLKDAGWDKAFPTTDYTFRSSKADAWVSDAIRREAEMRGPAVALAAGYDHLSTYVDGVNIIAHGSEVMNEAFFLGIDVTPQHLIDSASQSNPNKQAHHFERKIRLDDLANATYDNMNSVAGLIRLGIYGPFTPWFTALVYANPTSLAVDLAGVTVRGEGQRNMDNLVDAFRKFVYEDALGKKLALQWEILQDYSTTQRTGTVDLMKVFHGEDQSMWAEAEKYVEDVFERHGKFKGAPSPMTGAPTHDTRLRSFLASFNGERRVLGTLIFRHVYEAEGGRKTGAILPSETAAYESALRTLEKFSALEAFTNIGSHLKVIREASSGTLNTFGKVLRLERAIDQVTGGDGPSALVRRWVEHTPSGRWASTDAFSHSFLDWVDKASRLASQAKKALAGLFVNGSTMTMLRAEADEAQQRLKANADNMLRMYQEVAALTTTDPAILDKLEKVMRGISEHRREEAQKVAQDLQTPREFDDFGNEIFTDPGEAYPQEPAYEDENMDSGAFVTDGKWLTGQEVNVAEVFPEVVHNLFAQLMTAHIGRTAMLHERDHGRAAYTRNPLLLSFQLPAEADNAYGITLRTPGGDVAHNWLADGFRSLDRINRMDAASSALVFLRQNWKGIRERAQNMTEAWEGLNRLSDEALGVTADSRAGVADIVQRLITTLQLVSNTTQAAIHELSSADGLSGKDYATVLDQARADLASQFSAVESALLGGGSEVKKFTSRLPATARTVDSQLLTLSHRIKEATTPIDGLSLTIPGAPMDVTFSARDAQQLLRLYLAAQSVMGIYPSKSLTGLAGTLLQGEQSSTGMLASILHGTVALDAGYGGEASLNWDPDHSMAILLHSLVATSQNGSAVRPGLRGIGAAMQILLNRGDTLASLGDTVSAAAYVAAASEIQERRMEALEMEARNLNEHMFAKEAEESNPHLAALREAFREAVAHRDAQAAQAAQEAEAAKAREAEAAPPTRAPLNVWYGTGENARFSNLAPRAFTYEGRDYRSVEHAYQTLKGGKFHEATYQKYLAARDGSKIRGPQGLDVPGREALMLNLVRESYQQNPDEAQALIRTGDRVITHTQETSEWREAFPRILTQVRQELQEVPPVAPPRDPAPKRPITFIEDASSDYRSRTQKNAEAADVTADFALTRIGSGGQTGQTRMFTEHAGNTYVNIKVSPTTIDIDAAVQSLVQQIKAAGHQGDISLQIAGHGLSRMEAPQGHLDRMVAEVLALAHPILGQDGINISEILSGGQTGFDEAGAKAGMALGIPVTVLAPKGWRFRDATGRDRSGVRSDFTERFRSVSLIDVQAHKAQDALSKVLQTFTQMMESPTDNRVMTIELFDKPELAVPQLKAAAQHTLEGQAAAELVTSLRSLGSLPMFVDAPNAANVARYVSHLFDRLGYATPELATGALMAIGSAARHAGEKAAAQAIARLVLHQTQNGVSLSNLYMAQSINAPTKAALDHVNASAQNLESYDARKASLIYALSMMDSGENAPAWDAAATRVLEAVDSEAWNPEISFSLAERSAEDMRQRDGVNRAFEAELDPEVRSKMSKRDRAELAEMINRAVGSIETVGESWARPFEGQSISYSLVDPSDPSKAEMVEAIVSSVEQVLNELHHSSQFLSNTKLWQTPVAREAVHKSEAAQAREVLPESFLPDIIGGADYWVDANELPWVPGTKVDRKYPSKGFVNRMMYYQMAMGRGAMFRVVGEAYLREAAHALREAGMGNHALVIERMMNRFHLPESASQHRGQGVLTAQFLNVAVKEAKWELYRLMRDMTESTYNETIVKAYKAVHESTNLANAILSAAHHLHGENTHVDQISSDKWSQKMSETAHTVFSKAGPAGTMVRWFQEAQAEHEARNPHIKSLDSKVKEANARAATRIAEVQSGLANTAEAIAGISTQVLKASEAVLGRFGDAGAAMHKTLQWFSNPVGDFAGARLAAIDGFSLLDASTMNTMQFALQESALNKAYSDALEAVEAYRDEWRDTPGASFFSDLDDVVDQFHEAFAHAKALMNMLRNPEKAPTPPVQTPAAVANMARADAAAELVRMAEAANFAMASYDESGALRQSDKIQMTFYDPVTWYYGSMVSDFRGTDIRDILLDRQALLVGPDALNTANYLSNLLGLSSSVGDIPTMKFFEGLKTTIEDGAITRSDENFVPGGSLGTSAQTVRFDRPTAARRAVHQMQEHRRLTREEFSMVDMVLKAALVALGDGHDGAMPFSATLNLADMGAFLVDAWVADRFSYEAMQERMSKQDKNKRPYHLDVAIVERLRPSLPEGAVGDRILANYLQALQEAYVAARGKANDIVAHEGIDLSTADFNAYVYSEMAERGLIYARYDTTRGDVTEARLAVPLRMIEAEWNADNSAYAKLLKNGRTDAQIGFQALFEAARPVYDRMVGQIKSIPGIVDGSGRMFGFSLANDIPFFAGGGMFQHFLAQAQAQAPADLQTKIQEQIESFEKTMEKAWMSGAHGYEAYTAEDAAGNDNYARAFQWLRTLYPTQFQGTPEAMTPMEIWARVRDNPSIRQAMNLSPTGDVLFWEVAKAINQASFEKLLDIAWNGSVEERSTPEMIGLQAFTSLVQRRAAESQESRVREHATWREIYNVTGALPQSMNLADHLSKTASEASTMIRWRTAMNQLLVTENEAGVPLVVMNPGAVDDNTIPDEMWKIAAQNWVRAYGRDFDSSFVYNGLESGRENAARLYEMIAAANTETRQRETVDVPPGLRAVREILVLKGATEADGYLVDKAGGIAKSVVKQVLAVPGFMTGDEGSAAIRRVLSWSKSMSVMWSMFFPIATAFESPTGAIGLLPTLMGYTQTGSKTARKLAASQGKIGEIFRAMGLDPSAPGMAEIYQSIGAYDPSYVDMVTAALASGLEFSNRARNIQDQDRTLVAKDIDNVVRNIRGTLGEQAARNAKIIFDGIIEESSELAFEYIINATKLAVFFQMNNVLRAQALQANRSWDPLSDMRRHSHYINAEVGGIDMAQYPFMSPRAQYFANVGFFSLPWTLGAWDAGGGNLLTAPLLGMTLTKQTSARILLRWARMYFAIMYGVPLVQQLVAVALSKAVGAGDDDDKWFIWQNEKGKDGSHADVTPFLRVMAKAPALPINAVTAGVLGGVAGGLKGALLSAAGAAGVTALTGFATRSVGDMKKSLPEKMGFGLVQLPMGGLIPALTGQEGDRPTTRKRRYYVRNAKQGWEIAGWFINPMGSFLGKTSLPVQKISEGILGINAATGWDMPFKDDGFWQRWFSLDPEGSASLNVGRAFLPFSYQGIMQNPETGVISTAAAVSKGVSASRARIEMTKLFTRLAGSKSYAAMMRGRQGAFTDFRHIAIDYLHALRINGYDPETEMKSAIAEARKPLYREFHKALPTHPGDKGDLRAMERVMRGLYRLNVVEKNLMTSIKGRDEVQNIVREGEFLDFSKELVREAFLNPYGVPPRGGPKGTQRAELGGDVSGFLATDGIPETILDYSIVPPDGLSEEDIAFFQENPDVPGFYEKGPQ